MAVDEEPDNPAVLAMSPYDMPRLGKRTVNALLLNGSFVNQRLP